MPQITVQKEFPGISAGSRAQQGAWQSPEAAGVHGESPERRKLYAAPQGVFPRHRPPEHVCAWHTRSPGKASSLDQVPEAKQDNDVTCLQGPAPKVVCDLNPTAASRPVTKGLAALINSSWSRGGHRDLQIDLLHPEAQAREDLAQGLKSERPLQEAMLKGAWGQDQGLKGTCIP